ncbi:tRNA (guanine(26)-N(2))-dimethyltransferase, putative [Plasmodium yoelii]|uniref:tRNA (guanine(26)-N(2))-dimethyltransferase n=3 Tax=Plasmodium yoelii TaxID=5861 RepID=A0AAE9WV63_PLAYO|nr:tRNA (guanine(26)-N(2))-dimethyltransferase, putative [Plasmodium yoelii]WBY60772.1 tRNA (guanine(26)-N(2))-dimethyltransferase [Plasmodium yoelii yoelii]CDU20548.1 N2,N2-dimethylguanosine tRNA methyltransferase, putative [Plasmodium yoelii]VTZ81509.1 tRNA (guanine(26)-N(2))-dimethyltransferase, putative [Plasmodium yoelii]|eukprot:XP_724811.2 tRNA (guanine(26)-N(2))-dimethyltransferase, putative [Plasmodium yoelii]
MTRGDDEIPRNDSHKRNYVRDDNVNKKHHGSDNPNGIKNNVEENDKNMKNGNNKHIYEGCVKIKNKNKHIFYNKAQVFNRDMSIVLIKSLELYLKNKNKDNEKTIFRGFNIIELLSASGIRSIRYVKELKETINHIVTNDIDKYACKQIRRNFKRNNIDNDKYTILCNDANVVMNILNVDNGYMKKRNNKKLDIGFTYINNTNNYNEYFKEALKFLKFITTYNNTKTFEGDKDNHGNKNIYDNEKGQINSNGYDSDSTNFSFDDEINTKIDIIKENKDLNNICNGNMNDISKNANIKTMDEKEEDKTNAEMKLMETSIDEEIKKKQFSERYIFDIIDIDPYGSSICYLESCIKYGRSNFFMLITNTDMRILNGKFPDVSFYKYNSMIFNKNVNYNNEFSIRVLLYKLKNIASKYKKHIIPFCSLNIDFYIRMLVQVLDDPLQTKDLCIDTGIVYQCTKCTSFHVNPVASKKTINFKETNNSSLSQRRKINKKKKELLNSKDTNLENNYIDKNQTVIDEKETKYTQLDDDEITNKGKETEMNFTDKVTGDMVHGNDTNSHIGYKYKNCKLNVSNKCEECGGDILIGGPIYIGKLHNNDFISTSISLLENLNEHNLNTIKTRERILINLRCLKQEINVPLYYNLQSLFRNFKVSSFSRKIIVNALLNLNYEVSYFHRDPDSIKTNAPNHIFMDVFRAIIFKINSKNKKNSNNTHDMKNEEVNDVDQKVETKQDGNNNNSNLVNKIYSIHTIKDEKLKEKLLTCEFFKKKSSFDNINISNFMKNQPAVKLFTIENPEPFWGPLKKHSGKS